MYDTRHSKRVPLDIYLNKIIRGIPFMARTSDISEAGIYLTELIEPELGETRIGLQFQLPGSNELIYAEGIVMRDGARNRAAGQGFRFTLIADRHRRMIARFVERRARAAA